MKKILAIVCGLLSLQSLDAQQGKKTISLNLAGSQSFTLLKATPVANGYLFIGRVTTPDGGSSIDSLAEISTDTSLNITSRKSYFIRKGQTPADESIKARYPEFFKKENYTTGTSGYVESTLLGGKRFKNQYVVTPVYSNYNDATATYEHRTGSKISTDLSARFGTNVTEIPGYTCKFVDAAGNYSTILSYYQDRDEDMGKENKKFFTLRFNSVGALEAVDSFSFPIERYIYKKSIVLNSKNEYKGLVYLFSCKPVLLKFKASEPTDLQYNLVYVNEKGKIVSNSVFTFGNKKFDLYPMGILEKDGKLEMMTRYFDDSTRYLSFDQSGNLEKMISMPLDKKQLIKDRSDLAAFFSATVQDWTPMANFTNKNGEIFWLIRHSDFNGQVYIYQNATTYGNFFYYKVNADKSIKMLQAFADVSGVAAPNVLPEIIPIQTSDDFGDLLVKNRFSDTKTIWRLGDPRFPDVPHGISPHGNLIFSNNSIAKINSMEYYVAASNGSDIIVNRIVMELPKKKAK